MKKEILEAAHVSSYERVRMSTDVLSFFGAQRLLLLHKIHTAVPYKHEQ